MGKAGEERLQRAVQAPGAGRSVPGLVWGPVLGPCWTPAWSCDLGEDSNLLHFLPFRNRWASLDLSLRAHREDKEERAVRLGGAVLSAYRGCCRSK